MKPAYPIYSIVILLLGSMIFSGCVSQRVAQQDSLVGELFREDPNNKLPSDLQRSIVERRKQYKDINDINFVLMREDGEIANDEFEKLLTLRWELLRDNRRNELLLENTKKLMKAICDKKIEAEDVEKSEMIVVDNFDRLRTDHKEFMKQSQNLLDEAQPYRQGLLYKFI